MSVIKVWEFGVMKLCCLCVMPWIDKFDGGLGDVPLEMGEFGRRKLFEGRKVCLGGGLPSYRPRESQIRR